jgi:predicted DNA-binding protein (MmcQ/YjbR family)
MAEKKSAAPRISHPRSFTGVVRGRSQPVQKIAKALRSLVFEELPDAQESFYGGQRPMSIYRTTADVCWIQPLKERCNVYFMRGRDLTDPDGLLEGNSDRHRYVRVRSVEAVDTFPLREWLSESISLNEASVSDGMNFDAVLETLRAICLTLPHTKETLTWNKPYFRVSEKIFCGCGEVQGKPSVGLRMEQYESEVMMKSPGIEKAPYSRKGDGWVSIDPNVFDDWTEIERFITGSYDLVAPSRLRS